MNLQSFDVIQYLEDRGIEYRLRGKNVSRGWVEINCLWCDDPSFHLGISPQRFLNCWRCGSKGSIINLICKIDKCSKPAAKEILKQYSHLTDETLNIILNKQPQPWAKSSLSLPGRPGLHDQYRDYLIKRKFNPDFLEVYYRLRSGPIAGRYHHRIIIPIIQNQQPVSFLARSISNSLQPKYLASPSEQSLKPIKHCLYGIDEIKDEAVIVEGVTDVWRWGPGAVAVFGKTMTWEQIQLLKSRAHRVTVLLDADAHKEAEKLVHDLDPFFDEVRLMNLIRGDVADLNDDELMKLKKKIYLF